MSAPEGISNFFNFGPHPYLQRTIGNQAVQRMIGDREDLPAQDTGAIPLDDPKAATCSEKVDWQPDSPVPVTITADSAEDFVNKANAALGNAHMSGSEEHSFEIDGAGRITKVNMKVTTSIVRPRGGGGRVKSDAEKDLIKRIETFIKNHEEKHRDAYRAIMQQAVCDALGKITADAVKVISDASCKKTPAAHAAIDNKEGKVELVRDDKGNPVDFKTTGVAVDYNDNTCK